MVNGLRNGKRIRRAIGKAGKRTGRALGRGAARISGRARPDLTKPLTREEQAFQMGFEEERRRLARERGKRKARQPTGVRRVARGVTRATRVTAKAPRLGIGLFVGATREIQPPKGVKRGKRRRRDQDLLGL